MCKIFLGTIPYRLALIVHAIFIRLIFVAAINYENSFTTKIFRFTVIIVDKHFCVKFLEEIQHGIIFTYMRV